MKTIIIVVLILILFVLCIGCDKNYTEPGDETITLFINVESGNFQQGSDDEALVDPIVVRIIDSGQVAQADISVHFQIIVGDGHLNSPTTRTDSDGRAEVFWTLGNGPEHIMKVSITDRNYSGEPVYVFARTEIIIDLEWISDINFPRLFGRDIAHDNRILESNHFLVFSDASSDDAKIRFAKMAEETFHEVMQVFHVQSSEEFGIREFDAMTKPKLFSNVNTIFPYGGFAYNAGYIYFAFDSETYLQWPEHLKDIYRSDIKHETVHLIQFLVGLDNLPNLWPDVWFSEGLAVYLSNNRPLVASNEEVEEWRQIPGNENPITVKDFNNYPTQGRRWYHMFGTAVQYLLHENGHGKTTTDVLDMYRYMASSRNGFADAFERYMGMSVQYYEDHYWNLITDFLK